MHQLRNFGSDTLLRFEMTAAQKKSDVEIAAKFHTEGWASTLGLVLSFTYDRTSRIDLMGVLCATAENSTGLLKKKKVQQ